MLKSYAVVAVLALGACSSGSSSTSSSSGGSGGGAGFAGSTLLGLPVDTSVAMQSHTASLDGTTGTVSVDTRQVFTFRSREDFRNGEDFRRINYGKPRLSYHPTRNYTIPITITTSGGQQVGTGTATFSGDDVEGSVASRTFTITDIELGDSIFGLFSTDDTGIAPRGDFFEIHAYNAGIAATALPGMATYTGTFLADVISDGGTGATRIELPANLSVDFTGNLVTGTMGATGTPDISLNGTVSGTDISGTATVTSTAVTLANGSVGAFAGGVYGAGASEIGGTLGISDTSGATNHEMVGAFGATKN